MAAKMNGQRNNEKFASSEILGRLDESERPKEDPAISLCLIAKNEEKFIQRCIESVDGLCDQVVVVDTGSTDRTVEIAEAAGAELHYFEWTGSFSEARNESIKYATGDWVMIMDADGELAEESKDVIRDLVRSHRYPATFCGKSINYLGDGTMVTEAVYRMLFPNHHGIRFTGGVHEQLKSTDPDVKLLSQVVNVYMHHYGYLSEVMKEKDKVRFYGDLTDKELAENPDDFLTRYHAGAYFVSSREWSRAEKEMWWCLGRLRDGRAGVQPEEPWFGLVLANLTGIYERTGRHQEAINCARECLSYDSNDLEAQYRLGRSLAHLDQLDEAAEVFYRLIYESPTRPASPLVDKRSLQSWMARKELGQTEIRRGNYADAWHELELAIQENPKDSESWILATIAACALEEFDAAVEAFGVATSLSPPVGVILQAYEAIRLEATDPAPVEAVIRESLKLWPDNVLLKQMLREVLMVRLTVEDIANGSEKSDETENIRALAEIVQMWPSWSRAQEIHNHVAA